MKDPIRIINAQIGDSLDRAGHLGAKAVRISVDVTAAADDATIAMGKTIQAGAYKWMLKLDFAPLLKAVFAETGGDARMFVRKSERGVFENVLKAMQAYQAAGVIPDYVELDSEAADAVPNATLKGEELTRMLNGAINAVKAINPATLLFIRHPAGCDNEVSKKWYNRFSVSGGKPYDGISLDFKAGTDNLYQLSTNLSDISRRFDKEMIVNIVSGETDSTFDDILAAVSTVPMDKGHGITF